MPVRQPVLVTETEREREREIERETQRELRFKENKNAFVIWHGSATDTLSVQMVSPCQRTDAIYGCKLNNVHDNKDEVEQKLCSCQVDLFSCLHGHPCPLQDGWSPSVIAPVQFSSVQFSSLKRFQCSKRSAPLTPSLPQPVTFPVERCTDAPANSVFSGPITSTFDAMCFDESPFTCQCEKEDKMLKGFKFRNFIVCLFIYFIL